MTRRTALICLCINRNILECKDVYSLVGETSRHVLIETYWNVKINAYNLIWNEWFVLIETYWNVKMTPAETSRNEEIGINRNILECKDQSSFFSYRAKVSINRNILECKALPDNQRLHPKSVLIETYWNVKTAI